jgi:hypothetical protein
MTVYQTKDVHREVNWGKAYNWLCAQRAKTWGPRPLVTICGVCQHLYSNRQYIHNELCYIQTIGPSVYQQLQAGRLGFNYWQQQEFFLYSTASTPVLWPPSLLSNGIREFFTSGQSSWGCEAEHSPSSVKIKNGGTIPPLPHMSSWHGTGGEQNNGNTKKLRNEICVGYIERTSVGNTECCSSICLHSVVLISVH